MYISVVVCTYNRSKILQECLSSILNSKYSEENYEVIVVDNNSSDDTKDVVETYQKKFRNIRYCFEKTTGLSYARNKGIIEAKGEFIAFLDDDTTVFPNYLNAIHEFYQSNPNFVFASGKINPIWKIEKPNWFTSTFASIVAETMYGERDRILNHGEIPIGANMIFKKKIFEEIGNFNVNLGIKGDKLYLGEENDLYNKVIKKGYNVHYIANAIVNHTVHANKVDKEYVRKRLILEGESSAQISLSVESKGKCIYLLLRRCLILTLRDIPMLVISNITGEKNFDKKCKYERSLTYIKTMLNGIMK